MKRETREGLAAWDVSDEDLQNSHCLTSLR